MKTTEIHALAWIFLSHLANALETLTHLSIHLLVQPYATRPVIPHGELTPMGHFWRSAANAYPIRCRRKQGATA